MAPTKHRAIPGLVEDDITPPPHDLGAGAQLAWDHAEAIGRRVSVAVGDQLAELATQVQALRTASLPPAAVPPAKSHAALLQTLGIVLALLGVAFVLYRELTTLAVKVDTLTEQQRRSDEESQRRMERLEDRVYDLQAPRAPATTPPAVIGP
jgi:hypothetical protein